MLTAFEARLEHHQGDGIGYRDQYSKAEIYRPLKIKLSSPFATFSDDIIVNFEF